MVSGVDRNIKIALSECARRAELLRSEGSSKALLMDSRRHKETTPRPPLHLLYTRMLSCVVLPVSSSMWESGDWCANDYKLLREWCSKCGTYERVTEHQHRTSLEYIDGDEGKGALMAVRTSYNYPHIFVSPNWLIHTICFLQGLNSRLELINKHPFYNRQAFNEQDGGEFEVWKLSELEVLHISGDPCSQPAVIIFLQVIERQKASLVAYTKREVYLDIFECRPSHSLKENLDVLDSVASSSNGSSDALPPNDGAMDEPLVASHDTSPASSGTWFGGGGKKLSKMFKSPVSMVRNFSAYFTIPSCTIRGADECWTDGRPCGVGGFCGEGNGGDYCGDNRGGGKLAPCLLMI